ncbi:unnamed protein product [Lathyrus oleraceus]
MEHEFKDCKVEWSALPCEVDIMECIAIVCCSFGCHGYFGKVHVFVTATCYGHLNQCFKQTHHDKNAKTSFTWKEG